MRHVLLLVLLAGFAPQARAQAPTQVRGFADIGATSFAAAESFDTIFGSHTGLVFGGGVEVALRRGWFAGLRVSRFSTEGERVFLFEGQRFGLGVPTTVTVVPIVISAGYRHPGWRGFAPYGAGGIGWHRYRETSDGAIGDEDVSEQFTGYHVLGGVEHRVSTLIAAAGEVEWATVPDALGTDPNGVSAAFGEHNLGGATIRVKIVVGR